MENTGVMTQQGVRAGLPSQLLACVLAAAILGIGGGAARAEPVKKGKYAVDRIIAIYVPENEINTRIYIPQLGASFAPGKALEDAGVDAGTMYFKSALLFNPHATTPFNVLLVTHSKWESKDSSTSVLTVKYRVLDAAGAIPQRRSSPY
jgi:hypothetical protein